MDGKEEANTANFSDGEEQAVMVARVVQKLLVVDENLTCEYSNENKPTGTGTGSVNPTEDADIIHGELSSDTDSDNERSKIQRSRKKKMVSGMKISSDTDSDINEDENSIPENFADDTNKMIYQVEFSSDTE